MRFEVYCDESQQDLFAGSSGHGSQRVVLGGLWIEADSRKHLKETIADLRRKHNLLGEFKWTRVSPSRKEFYTELVDLFFACDEARFRAVVLRADELDAVQFHGGDAELMFYKFYYLLLNQWILAANTYRIFLDTKTNRIRQRLPKLHDVLASANRFSVVEQVQALPSKEVDLLQLADVLIGAVSYRLHDRKASASKLCVAQEIEHHIGHPIGCTGCAETKLNVFCWHSGGGW